MSDQPKKRPLFQLHLSTCIVLMFVAGGLIWANLGTPVFLPPAPAEASSQTMIEHKMGIDAIEKMREYGWPAIAYTHWTYGKPPWWAYAVGSVIPIGALVDCIVAVGLLTTSYATSEWLLRRKERRP
ncbi:MAG TPA: hypothetical protein VGP72_12990 [Planctomycetota bacterium]|jgi:hypothetical protein